MKANIFARSLVALAVTVAASSVSASEVVESGFTFSVGGSYQLLSRNIDDSFGPQIGLGYRFDPRFSLEAIYNPFSSNSKSTNADADLVEYRLDAMYDLTPWDGTWTPYVVVGGTHLDVQVPAKEDGSDTRITAGLGLRKAFTANLSASADVRYAYGINDSTNEGLANIALTYTFGSSTPEPAPVVVAPVVEEVIVEEVVVLDGDNDGVIDADDQCPNTAAGVAVDAIGCNLITKVEAEVRFGFDSATVVEDGMPKLDEVAQFMQQNPSAQTLIEGHTDSTGPAAYNETLSAERAQKVSDLLVAQYQIDAARIELVGKGEGAPIAPNDTHAGRTENRRAIITAEIK